MIQFPIYFTEVFNDEGWEPHPFAKGLERKTLLTRENDRTAVTVYLFRGNGGKVEDVQFHQHESADEYTYILKGEGKFEIDGEGTVELKPGSMICVPKGTRHRAYDCTDDLTTMSMYSPAIA